MKAIWSYSVAAGEDAASSNASNMAAGQYGTLFINADGTYSYQLNNQLKEVRARAGRRRR